MKRIRAFLKMVFGNTVLPPEFPYTVFMSVADMELLKNSGVVGPFTRGSKNAGQVALALTYTELADLRAAVMRLAQDGIARAAKRQLSTLPRRTHRFGVLAGYLHSIWCETPEAIAERGGVDNVIHLPAESPQERALSG